MVAQTPTVCMSIRRLMIALDSVTPATVWNDWIRTLAASKPGVKLNVYEMIVDMRTMNTTSSTNRNAIKVTCTFLCFILGVYICLLIIEWPTMLFSKNCNIRWDIRL